MFSSGFRYRIHRIDLPGKHDLVFPKYKTIVFIHGCFWHGHPCKIGSGKRKVKTNISYWNQKILKNKLRDKNNRKKLSKMGLKVIVVWECKTRSKESLLRNLEPLLIMKGNG